MSEEMQGVSQRLDTIEGRQREIWNALWGHPDMRQDEGLVAELKKDLSDLSSDLSDVKSDVAELKQTNVESKAEKRGRDRIIASTGITSLLTLLTLVGLLITIWQGLSGA